MKPARKNSALTFLLFLILSSLIYSGCNDPKQIPDNAASEIYVDLLLVQETYANSDSLNYYRENIFKKYGFSEEEYIYTLKSYSKNAEQWERFFDRAESRLDSLKALKKDEKLST